MGRLSHVLLPVAVSLALALVPVRVEAGGLEPALIVKFRSEGPAALDACAEQLHRAGRPFASATRDRSTSLDELFVRHDLGAPRVVFPSGRSMATLAERREALSRRLARRTAARSHGARARLIAPPDLSPIYRIPLRAGRELEAARAALAADPHVEYVQLDHALVLDQIVPPQTPRFDDPFLASAGSWGQPYLDLWGLYEARVPEVWSRAEGEGVVVAVVDTGLDADHPDIAANVWVNPGEDLDGNGVADESDRNGIDDDRNGFVDDLTGFDFANSVDANEDGDFDDPGDVSDADPTDDLGHGTHVAGTIAAVADNGIGIVGVAPRARIMALKGFRESGSASDSVLWRAVLYAAENGAAVVNNSWSCGSPCPSNPLAEDVLEVVEALGTLVVTSAGNRGTDVAFFSPENGARVITVGAIAADRGLPEFTNRGWLVDLVAPGGGPDEPSSIPEARRNILSLRARDTFTSEAGLIVGDDYIRLSGTSMSSPHVAGAVAILRGLRPELSPADVRRLVRLSARDLGSAGYDPYFGAGLLDALALADAPSPDAALALEAPPVGLIHDPATGLLELHGAAAGDDIAALEIDVASGLSGRDFRPLQSFGRSTLAWKRGSESGAYHARWDVAEVADGPQAIRVRARLRDGRLLDEFTLVGLERNPPIRISRGEGDATSADLSGRSLVWQIPGAGDEPGESDLVLGRFPGRHGPPFDVERVLERAGNQRDAVREGAELAWLEHSGTSPRVLLRCRIAGFDQCAPTLASAAPGSFGPVFLAGGWLVWARTDGGSRFIEGCPLGPTRTGCAPRPLIDPATGLDWTLHSFDGESLLASRPGDFIRCRLAPRQTACSPESLQFPSGEAPVEPRHDGDLMAFSRVDIEAVRPPGCAPSDPRPSCARRFIATVEYVACAIDAETSVCDPIVLSEKQPVERALGLAVSGRRIAWSMGTADEEPALRYCEFQPMLRECRPQRIGGALAPGKEPSLDGARIVWSDGRDGPFALLGLALPSLRGPEVREVRTGMEFVIPMSAGPGSSSSLGFELEGLSGATPEASHARVVDPGPPGGRVLLRGRLPLTAPSRSLWRVRAVGGGGLWSESVIELVTRP